MNLIKTAVLLLLFVTPFFVTAADAAQPETPSRELNLEVESPLYANMLTDGPVQVEYFLDSDGRPYIISIWSNDENITRMIRNMIGDGSNSENVSDDHSLAITFYYNNIK